MPVLHIAFHLIELLADTLEPSDLPAGHVSLPGFTQPLDALPVARIEVETVGETFVYQYRDAEAFELIVNLGLVAQLKQNLALSGCELAAFPVDDVLEKTVGELGTLEARIIEQRFASGLKAAGSFLTRSISIQDAMSRAPLNCRDATQPTLCITCGRLWGK